METHEEYIPFDHVSPAHDDHPLRHQPSPTLTSPAVDILHTKFRHRQRQSAKNCASNTSCPANYHDELFVESARRAIQYLHGAWLDQALCDVILITSDGHLLAHKVVLAADSPSLDTLYRHQQQLLMDSGHEHTSGLTAQLDLSDFSMEPVADVVNFVYTGDIDLDNKNIGQVTACCRELGIALLVNICRKYLIDACDPYNVVLHYSIAANNSLNDLSDRLLRVICEAFPEVSRNRHILYLPLDRIISILSNHALCAEEMQVFQMIARWIDFQRHDRLQYACRLLKLVRFQLIQPEVLANEVQRIHWLFENPRCMEPVFEAYKYHALHLVGSSAVEKMALQDERCLERTVTQTHRQPKHELKQRS